MIDPYKALEPGATLVRPDRKDTNHIWHWEAGDKDATEKVFNDADLTVSEHIYIPRIHVAAIETCGCVASYDKAREQLTVYMTTQAPHAVRTVVALVAGHVGLSEERIRIISPDIGGGFGGKVPVSGYVVAIAVSFLLGKPIKGSRIEDGEPAGTRSRATYHIDAELALKKDGTITGLRVKTLADHGCADAAANPSSSRRASTASSPARTTSAPRTWLLMRPIRRSHLVVSRIAAASVAPKPSAAIERLADIAAHELKMDPAEFRLKNSSSQSSSRTSRRRAGRTTAGTTRPRSSSRWQKINYAELRREQLEKRACERSWASASRASTEIVGAGPRTFDILGLKMFDSAEIRIHPTGKAIARFGTKSQGQGHERHVRRSSRRKAYRQHVQVERRHRHGAVRSWNVREPIDSVAGAAGAMAARKIRDKARKIAAYLLEASEEDLEWTPGKFTVRGSPDRSKTIQEIAFAAYTNHPREWKRDSRR